MQHCPRSQSVVTALFWGLLTLGIVHALVHGICHLTWMLPRTWYPLPSWTHIGTDYRAASLAAMAAGAAAGVAALMLARRYRGRSRRGFAWTGGLLLYLMVEDLLQVPEALTFVGGPSIPRPGAFWWCMVSTLASILVALFCIRFLTRRFSTRAQIWMIVGGFGCMVAATAIEIAEFLWIDESTRLRGIPLFEYTVVPEELLELLGPALLFRCLGNALAAPRF